MPKKSKKVIDYMAYVGYDAKYYISHHDKIEGRIDAFAKTYNGECYGSGLGFGQRDLDYRFKSADDRANFLKEVRRYRKGLHITGIAEIDYSDED